MPLTKAAKQERVTQVEEQISAATVAVFVAYETLTVDDLEALRDTLFLTGSRLRVVPKRLLRLALREAAIAFDPTEHPGQIAVVWGSDAVAPAKTIYTFAKTHPDVRILAGALNRALLSAAEVNALAQLPSRSQLLQQLLSVLVGPMRNLLSVLTGSSRQLVYALQAVADQKSPR